MAISWYKIALRVKFSFLLSRDWYIRRRIVSIVNIYSKKEGKVAVIKFIIILRKDMIII